MSFKWTMITEEEALPLLGYKCKVTLRRYIKKEKIPKDWYFYNRDINRYFFKKEKITQAI